MTIVIYAMCKEAVGVPGQTYYSLEQPEFSSGFSSYINVSEYALPAGCHLTQVAGKPILTNAAGERCQLAGCGGGPLLISPGGETRRLNKCRDITLNAVMESLLDRG